ncbi:MAG: methyltransferase domain-containing protein [Armatimonadota bacterium]|nr:methyltransferase domain-containing protein [Armatimonadota bacterium]MDR7516230.1 methyltransferase domain-containing protein [Armatimonadota bacterium]MDR7560217.1 methyltransferase domain-containing protein [Armatimonadota bacterium]
MGHGLRGVRAGRDAGDVLATRGAGAAVFDELAERYDAWYDGPVGRVVFPLEVEVLRRLLEGQPRPWLEIGVGSGRFARALGVEVGVDPAWRPLRRARRRGIRVVRAVGERLPFPAATFGAVLAVVTLCFVEKPVEVLREARRVLRPDGALVLGMVFADSPWGDYYRRRGAAGHPFYSVARFLSRSDLAALLRRAGFTVVAAASTLRQPPTEAPRPEPVVEGDPQDAGFSGWKALPVRVTANTG